MKRALFLALFLAGCAPTKYVIPPLPALPPECGWNTRTGAFYGGEACEEFVRYYDALKGVSDDL